MLNRMKRSALGLAVAVSTAAAVFGGHQAVAQEKVLRVAMHAAVRTVDPLWTTQNIVGIQGMLVYDTLFSSDADIKPQPQMVDSWEDREDVRTQPVKYRDAMKFQADAQLS